MILDIIFVGLMLISFILGIKQGLVKSIWGLASWVITGIVVCMMLTPATNFLHGTKTANNIYDSIYSAISTNATSEENSLAELTSLPEWVVESTNTQAIDNITTNLAENTARTVSDIVIKIIAAVGLFIIVKLIFGILFIVINGFAKLPVISGVNRLLGAVFSMLGTLLAIYLAIALVSTFANPSIYEYINKTYIVKYLFNHNILMQLFIKI